MRPVAQSPEAPRAASFGPRVLTQSRGLKRLGKRLAQAAAFPQLALQQAPLGRVQKSGHGHLNAALGFGGSVARSSTGTATPLQTRVPPPAYAAAALPSDSEVKSPTPRAGFPQGVSEEKPP